MYSLGANKPLIGREQNYVLDRKLVTVHSEDRDITKYKNSNHFEITLPETIINVQSLRLIETSIPANLYTFSKKYQNTKLKFKLNGVEQTISIKEGFYDPYELASELTNKMNRGENCVGTDTKFNVVYDNVAQKYWFGHTDSSFSLLVGDEIDYSDNNNNICGDNNNIYSNSNIFSQYTNWGLPSYLGFNKKNISSNSTASISPIYFDFLGLAPDNIWKNKLYGIPITYYIEAPFKQNIMGEKCIYMEVEKYNSYDELYPYTKTIKETNKETNKETCKEMCKNIYNHSGIAGKVNSAFAKIPINAGFDRSVFESRTISLENITHYEPPIERIAKLKFTFRFHDGRYVDFQNNSFNFTIEFNSLKNEISRAYNVRVPHTYLI